MSTATIAERVARGAALLDGQARGWAVRINEQELDLGECERCILGQVYGLFSDGLKILFPNCVFRGDYSEAYGFDVTNEDMARFGGNADAAYSVLAIAWLAEIRARLAPPVPMAGPLDVAAIMNTPECVP